MANKTITFTVGVDGAVSPATEQKAGVQGNHNVTEVRFEGEWLSNIKQNPNVLKARIQFIDGSGGFFSTGFLTAYSDDNRGVVYVSCALPDDVTNAGGLAYAYLVITEIIYNGTEIACENQVSISNPGKLRFAYSGVGSPSEYAYKVGISNALVNAEGFATSANTSASNAHISEVNALMYANEANNEYIRAVAEKRNAQQSALLASDYADDAKKSAEDANTAKESAEKLKDEVETKLANGEFKGEPGETPDMSNYYTNKETDNLLLGKIGFWQPNTEYKVGDVCYCCSFDAEYLPRHALMVCKSNHISEYIYFDRSYWTVYRTTADIGVCDAEGKVIHETYATKKELKDVKLPNEITGDFTVNGESESVKLSDGKITGRQGGGSYEISPDGIDFNGFFGRFSLRTDGVVGNDTAKASWKNWLGIGGENNALKGNLLGTAVFANDVSPVEHNVSCTLTSDTITDFSTVEVKRYGKNLLSDYILTWNGGGWSSYSASADQRQFELPNIESGNDYVISFDIKQDITEHGYILLKELGENTDVTLKQWIWGGSAKKGTYSFNFKAKHGCKYYIRMWPTPTKPSVVSGGKITGYSNFQLELGTIATPYTPYIEPTLHLANADGTVEGVTSLAPNMTLLISDSGTSLNVEYNRDINVVVDDFNKRLAAIETAITNS